MTAAEDKWLLKQAGEKPRRLVPGTLSVAPDGLMTWTERCKATCRHRDDACHAARAVMRPRPAVTT